MKPAQCPNCHGTTTSVVYHRDISDCERFGYKTSLGRSHVHRSCTECGHDWVISMINQYQAEDVKL